MFIGIGIMMCVFSATHVLTIVGTVDGTSIRRGDINDYLNMRMNGLTLSYVQDKIKSEAIEELGITVSDSEVDEEYNKKVEEKGSEDALAEEMVQDGYSKEYYKYNIKKTLMEDKAKQYFFDKQDVSYEELESLYNNRKDGGNEIAIMNCKTILLDSTENSENVKFDELDQSRVLEETGIQTNTVFKTVPTVDAEAIANIDGKRYAVKVTEVHRGLDDQVVYQYVVDLMKTERATVEYQQYILDKVSAANVRLK